MQKLSPRAFRPELVLCGLCQEEADYHKATRRHKSSIEAVRDVGAARAYLSPPLHTFHLVQLSTTSTLRALSIPSTLRALSVHAGEMADGLLTEGSDLLTAVEPWSLN